MLRDSNTRHDGEEPNAPAKLVAALKEPPSRRVFVPTVVDHTIFAAARRHLAQPEQGRRSWLSSWLRWPAFATALVLLAGLGYLIIRSQPAREFAREDINRDGQVDILDALQLAREAQASARATVEHDLNGDGLVDWRDAEVIAARAVQLEKGGRS